MIEEAASFAAADMTLDAALTANAPIGTAEKVALAAVSIACFFAWKLIFIAIGLPAEPHLSSLLVKQGIIGVIAIGIFMPVLTLIATAILGRLRPEAGLFCAAMGLLALPTRGGDIRNALLDAGSFSVFLPAAIEQLILAAIVLGSLWIAARIGGALGAKFPVSAADDTASDRLNVVGSQAVAVLILLAFIGQSPAKGQAMVGVGLAGLLGALAIHQSYKMSGAMWYIAGTLVAGLVAYLWCRFTLSGSDIGDVSGFLAGPARSLPLHYASIGVAGTIYGYWISMTWNAAKTSADSGA